VVWYGAVTPAWASGSAPITLKRASHLPDDSGGIIPSSIHHNIHYQDHFIGTVNFEDLTAGLPQMDFFTGEGIVNIL
jgi:hypothetical protein